MSPGNVSTHDWAAGTRILFRFAFVYLFLYMLFGGNFQPLSAGLWNPVVFWVGEHVFQVSVAPPQITGSGDRLYDYVQVFCFLVLAAVSAAVWTLLDRGRRRQYTQMHEWLRFVVRLFLALAMLGYGSGKLMQFPALSLHELAPTVGEKSPMGILWTFMRSSEGYALFTGVAEVLGGLLLLASRRTVLLGALVCVGVMSNVVMLNFCYDVPVKLYSSHLLGMAVFLTLPGLKRLADVFVLNRRVEPAELRSLFARPWLHRTGLVLRTAFVAYLAVAALWELYETHKSYDTSAAPKSPFYGVWNVEEFEADGEVRPDTDPIRWRRVVFDHPVVIGIDQVSSEAWRQYLLQMDADAKTLTLTNPLDSTRQSAVAYREPEPGVLVLEGTFDGRTVRARLRRTECGDLMLVKRGFHWVNEVPLNR